MRSGSPRRLLLVAESPRVAAVRQRRAPVRDSTTAAFARGSLGPSDHPFFGGRVAVGRVEVSATVSEAVADAFENAKAHLAEGSNDAPCGLRALPLSRGTGAAHGAEVNCCFPCVATALTEPGLGRGS